MPTEGQRAAIRVGLEGRRLHRHARGSVEEAERAKTLLARTNPSRLQIHPTSEPEITAPTPIHEVA